MYVPASPEAPHMVDCRYLAGGAKTKRYLTDSEVLRLHQRRLTATADGLALLDVESAVTRSTTPAGRTRTYSF